MWECGLNLSWGSALMWVAWAGAVTLVASGFRLDDANLGQAGLVCSALAASMTVIRDNAKTRRVVRSSVREAREEKLRGV